MSNSTSRCRTKRSVSTNEPGSRSFSSRSREELPAATPLLDVARSRRMERLLAQLLEPAELRLGRVASSSSARSHRRDLVIASSCVGTTPVDRSTTWPYEHGRARASPIRASAVRRACGGGATPRRASTAARRCLPRARPHARPSCSALLSPGQVVALAEGAYYETGVMLDELRRWGVEKVEYDQTGAPPDGVDLVWLEAPSNPFLTMPNFEAAAAHPACVVCDSTATTPSARAAARFRMRHRGALGDEVPRRPRRRAPRRGRATTPKTPLGSSSSARTPAPYPQPTPRG